MIGVLAANLNTTVLIGQHAWGDDRGTGFICVLTVLQQIGPAALERLFDRRHSGSRVARANTSRDRSGHVRPLGHFQP